MLNAVFENYMFRKCVKFFTNSFKRLRSITVRNLENFYEYVNRVNNNKSPVESNGWRLVFRNLIYMYAHKYNE